MSSEILAAILGALLAGGLQTIIAIVDRRRERETILTAIASEVDSICRLIRHQRYLEYSNLLCEKIRSDSWEGDAFVIDIRSNYFSVYEGLVAKLGNLEPKAAAKIVNFYAYCKSIIDSVRPDGPHSAAPSTLDSAANMISMNLTLRAVLQLGDEIIQLPKIQIFDMSTQTLQ